MHVYIGWMDDEKVSTVDEYTRQHGTNLCDFQTVHILRLMLVPRRSQASHQGLDGILDLASAPQAIQLSYLVLSLGSQFRILDDILRCHHASRVGWRADDHSAAWTNSIISRLQSVGTSDRGRYVFVWDFDSVYHCP